MGQQDVDELLDERHLRAFMKALLDDVRALELLLETGGLERDIRRIGAEQEYFLVDQEGHPSCSSLNVLGELDPARFTTELAQFNVEANLLPQEFGGNCLSALEKDLDEALEEVREAASRHDAHPVLVGILPSLEKGHLSLDNMTPNPRYYALNRAITALRAGVFDTRIKGVDELSMQHDNVMLEACNTSFQIHFQVSPDEFANLYNVAQLVTAPALAAAVNSPMLLGKRLWRETRVALFQQSVDARSLTHQARGQRTRVRFGDSWVEQSVLEIFREDIARFRVVLGADVEADSLQILKSGGMPELSALRLHNGTVYRWNRPCYGVHEGVAHLRIENRSLPSGPTVVDEVANAAFFFGLMVAELEEYGDVAKAMNFDVAKSNFFHAARHGLDAQFEWFDGKVWTACDLILDVLIPQAREGLEHRNIDTADIDRYLGVLEERVKTGRTGAQWMVNSWNEMPEVATRDQRQRALVSAMIKRQAEGEPCHEWGPATLSESSGWKASYRTVGQFMSTDLFTVRPHDLVDLAASLMEWEHLRYIPVEDDEGHLVGVVSYRSLLRLVGEGIASGNDPVSVESIMKKNPVQVSPDTDTIHAIRLMRESRVGCLPVVMDQKLVGLITEADLIEVSAMLLEEQLREP